MGIFKCVIIILSLFGCLLGLFSFFAVILQLMCGSDAAFLSFLVNCLDFFSSCPAVILQDVFTHISMTFIFQNGINRRPSGH